mgnify:FL=1
MSEKDEPQIDEQTLREAIQLAARQVAEEQKPEPSTTWATIRNWCIVALIFGAMLGALACFALGAWTIGAWILE